MRILKRTVFADGFLREVFDHFVHARGSISQMIQNSVVFQGLFKKNVQLQEGKPGSRIHNLRAAKHRMESFQKPLGRCVLYFPALMLTNEQIANTKKGKQVVFCRGT